MKLRPVLTLVVLAGATLVMRQVVPSVRHRVRLHLASLDIAAGRFDEAEARLALALDGRPAEPGPRLLLARLARRRGQITSAEEILQRAIELGLPLEEGRREHDLLEAGRTSAD